MNPQQKQRLFIIGGIVGVAILAVVVMIAMSGNTTTSGIDYSTIPTTRTEDGGVVLGNPDAPITIVEFADYACSYCIQYKPEMDRFVKEQVATGKAKYEFRVFPTAGGQITQFAGNIAYCIEDLKPGAYWETTDAFFQMAQSAQYNDQMGRTVAQRLGINYSDILECTGSATYIQDDIALAQTVGVTGTPAVAVRYGDGNVEWLQFGGTTYNRGPVPYNILEQVVAQVQ